MNLPAFDDERPRRKRNELSRIPPPPREPSPKARKLIFAYRGSQGVMLFIGGMFLLMGSLFTVIFCWGLPVDVAIGLSGTTVQGRGLEATLNRSVQINRQHPTTVRFSYRVDGLNFTDKVDTFDHHIIDAGNSGGPVVVEVARLNPAWARIEGTTYATFGFFGLFTAIFPVVGLGLLTSAVRSNRREIAAFTQGEPIRAHITYAGPDRSTKVNGRHPHKIVWQFEVDGQSYSGSLSTLDPEELADFPEGTEVTALYLPDSPGTNTLYID